MDLTTAESDGLSLLQKKKQLIVAKTISLSSRVLSRFYMSQFIVKQQILPKTMIQNYLACPKCGSIYQPDNFHIRGQPKMKMTKKIAKLLVRYKVSQKLMGKYQKKLVLDFLKSKNLMLIHCHICKMAVKIPCQDHKERLNQRLAADNKHKEKTVCPVLQQKKKKKKEVSSVFQIIANRTSVSQQTASPGSLHKEIADSPLMRTKHTNKTGSSTRNFMSNTCNNVATGTAHSSASHLNKQKCLASLLKFTNVSEEKKSNIFHKNGEKKYKTSYQQLSKILSRQREKKKKEVPGTSLSQFLSEC